MAASEEEPEALTEQLDVARRLENLPVSAWPPGTEPEPFQVGGGARPAQELRAAPGGVAGSIFHRGGARRSRALRAQPGGGAGGLPGSVPGCGKRGPLFIAVRGPLFIAVRGPLTTAAPPAAGHRLQTRRLSSCGPRAQTLRGTRDPPRPGPEPYTPDHVAGPGGDTDPTLITFPGCVCVKTPCLPGTCSCLRREKNYDDNLCLRHIGSEAKCAEPVFECNVLCQCSDHCRNRVVQRGLQFRLQVFKTDRKGWGLRTLDFIPKGRFVCEYAGEVLGFSEVQRRIQLQTIHDSNYIIAVREHVYNGQVMETFVDPTSIGNIGRFLNHSCEPNLLMIPVRINSMVPKLALFAAKDIVPEEELSYDYSGRFLNLLDSEDKERLDNGKLRKPCYCGAESCAAFLPYDSSLYCPLEKPNTSEEGKV
ncbi:hypothetical protein J1605_005467 [Eschrichtius robustus]|uniref:Histone-lysine N-methyltransferase SETMAR n=1 Tax=Eschrichtius robustus TaxID=9764 RepID=A0AB34H8D2_ESCRO|nr:hypothetical protein J1605_005467 [Eschrichtius robustus]